MVGVRFPLEKISCFLYCTIKITLGIDKLLKAHYLGSEKKKKKAYLKG